MPSTVLGFIKTQNTEELVVQLGVFGNEHLYYTTGKVIIIVLNIFVALTSEPNCSDSCICDGIGDDRYMFDQNTPSFPRLCFAICALSSRACISRTNHVYVSLSRLSNQV